MYCDIILLLYKLAIVMLYWKASIYTVASYAHISTFSVDVFVHMHALGTAS